MIKRIVGIKLESIFANGKEADYEIVQSLFFCSVKKLLTACRNKRVMYVILLSMSMTDMSKWPALPVYRCWKIIRICILLFIFLSTSVPTRIWKKYVR